METSEHIDKIFAAIVKAQGELAHARKDSTNPHFKSKYADLSSVWDAAKPVLAKNELAALQDAITTDGGVGVRTRIIHSSGQWVEFNPVIIPVSKRDAHGIGSALTYGRRYSLSAALGVVADEDDDGVAAVQTKGTDEVAVITPAQVKELQALLDETGSDIPKFLNYMRTTDIANIAAADFAKAKHALETKRKAIDKEA